MTDIEPVKQRDYVNLVLVVECLPYSKVKVLFDALDEMQ